MNLKNPSLLVVLGIVVVIVVGGYAYVAASTSVINALHERYDVTIEARVTVPPASSTPMATGTNSEAWNVDNLALDFGSPEAGKMTTPVPLKATNMILINDCRVHVRTDLVEPGIRLYVGENMATFDMSKIELNRTAKGVTFNWPTGKGVTQTSGWAVIVDPSVPPGEYTFHIVLSYSYCND